MENKIPLFNTYEWYDYLMHNAIIIGSIDGYDSVLREDEIKNVI